ncbi:uncharacterized protein AB675_2232 [Cyphellophora attinorum]|uniref:Uncharacterized protein n=1 Tax=Cyphellophora attinorum TaxID=1664694 RepID=A0A0N1H1S9_9EURO|nr:uncharacterized protein AB675_2232 [Phialophora attinorum]KPI34895.1 hypothetical protein AB675_2232 [Phialophora attinorum]
MLGDAKASSAPPRPVDQTQLATRLPVTRPRYASQPSLPTRPTRAWKLVDANKILTKRKYVKRKPKPEDAKQSSTEPDQTPEQAKTESSEDYRSVRSLSWPSPEADTIHTGGLRGNPFACYPSNTPTVHRALDFLVKEIGVNAVPGTVHKDGFSPKAAAFMQMGFQHDAVFHAVVAFARAYDEVANTGSTDPSAPVLYHRGKATQLLYERLKDPATRADDASILTTFLLVDNSWRYGEDEIGKAHYGGLLKMIEMRGGLENTDLPPALKASVDFGNVTNLGDQLSESTAPELPDLKYCGHPFPAQMCGLIARLPEGYAQIAMHGQLSLETMATIISLREWLTADPAERTPAPHRQIGAARRCMASSKPPDGSRVEEAVCFGIVITGMRSFHARFSRMDQSFLDRIVTLGEQFDKVASSKKKHRIPEREHVAYLTMVAVEASDRCIELQPHVKKLVDLLLARETFARSWAGMEAAIKRFFWVDFAADKWRECWLKHLRRVEEEKQIKKRQSKSPG